MASRMKRISSSVGCRMKQARPGQGRGVKADAGGRRRKQGWGRAGSVSKRARVQCAVHVSTEAATPPVGPASPAQGLRAKRLR